MADSSFMGDKAVENVQKFFISEYDESATSYKSKLNPLAEPFRFLDKTNSIDSSICIHEKVLASGNNFDLSCEIGFSSHFLDCTPVIINDAMTPDVSIRNDSFDSEEEMEYFRQLQKNDTSVGCPSSLIVQGKREVISGTIRLDPCAEPFVPKNPSGLKNLTQPVVVKQVKKYSSAPHNTSLITQINNDMDPKEILECLKSKHRDRPIIAHLNINFLDPKFEPLKKMIKDKVDILLISETKIDDSYPEGRFFIDGYKEPVRLDRNKNGGGLLFFIHDDLECKEISHKLPKKTEGIFLKLTIRNTKWLIMGGYNPKKENIKNFLDHIGRELDRFLPNYENLLLLGDFNSEMCEEPMKEFCETYNLSNMITDPTCFKSMNNPSCIDVMLTNRSSCFENSTVIETGLSDCHKMTITVMKKYFKKREPITITYRDYKNFDGEKFRSDLREKIVECDCITIEIFINILNELLDKHAPRKQKIIRGNSAPFMNETLSKAFMTRARLRNKYNRTRTEADRITYTKFKNFCTNLLAKEKKKYYGNLDITIFDDNKKFWQRVKPLFSDKTILKHNIRLKENGKMVSDKKEIAEILNNYFMESVEYLEVERYLPTVVIDTSDRNDNRIDDILLKFKDHPSILQINKNVVFENRFEFKDVTEDEMFNKIIKIDPSKACMKNDIPPKIILGVTDIISDPLTKMFNNAKKSEKYPKSFKRADVTALPKTRDKQNKKKYRPVSLTPIFSKLFEKHMYDQMSEYSASFISPYIFGYRKGHSTEQCVMVMIEMWKKALDEHKVAGAVLTDLSKAFDCLPHDLLVAKLYAYGFEKSACNFILDYLKDRTQRTKVDGEYSSYREVNYGVPQGSILGPLLFNLFMNDIFYFIKESQLANYADDTTAYLSKLGIFPFLHTLKTETEIVLHWFKINEMKSNSEKCHLIVAENNHRPSYISNSYIYLDKEKELLESETCVKLLGLWIDNKMVFEEHIRKLLSKGNQKLHALMRVAKYMTTEKLRVIMKSFIESQFKYCPLVWMFYSKKMHNRINKLHERALRVVYKNDDNLTFEELLVKDNSFSVHDRNLQKLAELMYKVKNGLCPLPLRNIFSYQDNTIKIRNKENGEKWIIPKVRTENKGIETLRYRGPFIWNLLPDDIKSAETLEIFRAKISKWKPEGCSCKRCNSYYQGLGYL